KKFKIAEGQWYRYAPSYVSPAYHLLEGFPFIQEPPSGDLQERVLIRHHDYDQCFQSVQLLQWNSQVKFNVTVYRNLPTTRRSEERFSRNAETDLVCRLLLEKKKKTKLYNESIYRKDPVASRGAG